MYVCMYIMQGAYGPSMSVLPHSVYVTSGIIQRMYVYTGMRMYTCMYVGRLTHTYPQL
jgi:hypothetical protein